MAPTSIDASPPHLPEDLARRVAVDAGADPRTVKMVANGYPVARLAEARVIDSFKRLGLTDYLPRSTRRAGAKR
jgi:hypothetical protein